MHAVEGRRDRLFKLGCHEHDGRTKKVEIGYWLALPEDATQVAIDDASRHMECLLFVLLLLVEFLDD